MATLWDVPSPILFNVYKHHAGFLRERIARAVAAGPDGLPILAHELIVVGAKLMDLYYGKLAPREVSDRVLRFLRETGRDSEQAFRAWVDSGGGYQVIELPEDGSKWVMRSGVESDRFIHIHPARNSAFTVRVRAQVLSTAVMSLAHAGCHGGEPLSRSTVNSVRKDFLGLPPIGQELSADKGLGAVVTLLGNSEQVHVTAP